MLKYFKMIFSGEMFFSLFLVSGYFKAALNLPFDFTLLFLILSFTVFCKRIISDSRINKYIIIPFALYTVLAALFLVSIWWSSSSIYSVDKAFRFVFVTGWAFIGGLFLIKDKDSAKRFLFSMLAISTIGSLFTIKQFLSNSSSFVALAGDNYLGAARLSGLGAMILVVYSFYGKRKFFSLIFLCVHVFALLSTGARMPLIAFVILFCVLAIRSIRFKKGSFYYTRNTKYILLLFLIIAVISSVLWQNNAFDTTIARLEVLFTEQNGGDSANGRLMRFSTAVETFQLYPLFGGGIGSFSLYYSGEDAREYPHNIFLELLSETGIIGLLLFLGLLAVVIVRFLSVNRVKGDNIMTISIFTGFLYMFLNAMVSGDLNDNRLLFTFVAISAMLPIITRNYTSLSHTKYPLNMNVIKEQ